MTVLLHRSPRRLVPSGKTPTLPEPAWRPAINACRRHPLQQRRLFDRGRSAAWASLVQGGGFKLLNPDSNQLTPDIMPLGKRVQGSPRQLLHDLPLVLTQGELE